jgi:hypothetical protein
MALDGMGPYQIARRIAVEKPSAYFARTKDWAFDGKDNAWNGGTVRNILSKPETAAKPSTSARSSRVQVQKVPIP